MKNQCHGITPSSDVSQLYELKEKSKEVVTCIAIVDSEFDITERQTESEEPFIEMDEIAKSAQEQGTMCHTNSTCYAQEFLKSLSFLPIWLSLLQQIHLSHFSSFLMKENVSTPTTSTTPTTIKMTQR